MILNLILYKIFLGLYAVAARIISLWNVKAGRWIKGRKHFPSIDYRSETHKVVWMHCASLGEFEQGRPLIEFIRTFYPSYKIVVSFFSPSGYEIMKNFKGAHVCYLPLDSKSNAKKFIDLVNPGLVLWVKYEYWYYYLHELKKKNIPVLLISGTYHKDMPFFKWYGSLHRKMLSTFTHFFVQNQHSKKVLQELINENKITNSGDTRFDRVIAIAEKFEEVTGIKEFCGDNKVIVAGSTWEDDEAEWVHYVKIHPEIKFIIAPHEVDEENLADIQKQFSTSIKYSHWIKGANESTGNNQAPSKTKNLYNCLIIDNIGMLSRLYNYATVCFVGGGFGYDGLHNILEAAVYGKPVIFGPEFEKNFEAVEMIESSGALSISNAIELEKILNNLLNDDAEIKRRGNAAKKYVYENAGATNKIMDYIQKNRLLTN